MPIETPSRWKQQKGVDTEASLPSNRTSRANSTRSVALVLMSSPYGISPVAIVNARIWPLRLFV